MRLSLLIAVFYAAVTMPASARDHDAKFLILHEGKVIGYHAVHVVEDEAGTVVETKIKMRVKLGPIPLFHYDHEAREVWRGDELVSLVSATNNDGDKAAVNAARVDGVLEIDGTGYRGPAPAGAVPTSYWNKSFVAADKLIDTQTGELMDVDVQRLGASPAPDRRLADHYRIKGPMDIDLWFVGERCVGSHFTVDGDELTYVPVPEERRYAALDERRK